MKINRNGPYMMNDAKKRYTEVKNSVKKDGEKKFQKETTNEKKKIDWEKEKDVLQKYIGKKYPLMSKQRISKIIEEIVNGYKLKTNNKCKCKKCTTEENVNKNGK